MLKLKLASTYEQDINKAHKEGYKKGYIDASNSKSTVINDLRECLNLYDIRKIEYDKNLKNAMSENEELKASNKYQERKIESLESIIEDSISQINDLMLQINTEKDTEIDRYEKIIKRCKKGRVKNKYRNKVLRAVEQRLLNERGYINE